jgi:hypothetical protein
MPLSDLTIAFTTRCTEVISLYANQMAAQPVYAQQQLERRSALLLGVTLSECRPIRLSSHESYCVCMYVSQCECRRHPPTHRPEPISRGKAVLACQVVAAAFAMHGDARTMLCAWLVSGVVIMATSGALLTSVHEIVLFNRNPSFSTVDSVWSAKQHCIQTKVLDDERASSMMSIVSSAGERQLCSAKQISAARGSTIRRPMPR